MLLKFHISMYLNKVFYFILSFLLTIKVVFHFNIQMDNLAEMKNDNSYYFRLKLENNINFLKSIF